MTNLFKYLKQLSGKNERQNSHRLRQIQDIVTHTGVCGNYDLYVVLKGGICNLIDADGNCIEKCRSIPEVKTDLSGKKIFFTKII